MCIRQQQIRQCAARGGDDGADSRGCGRSPRRVAEQPVLAAYHERLDAPLGDVVGKREPAVVKHVHGVGPVLPRVQQRLVQRGSGDGVGDLGLHPSRERLHHGLEPLLPARLAVTIRCS